MTSTTAPALTLVVSSLDHSDARTLADVAPEARGRVTAP